MEEQVMKQMIEALADIAECEIEDVKPDSHLAEELGVDSLMGLELLVIIERKYKVKIKEEELMKMTTPQIVTDMILERLETEVA